MILPFPLVFLISVLLSDLGYLLSGDPFWARAGFYLLLGGVVTGFLAAVPGVIDFSSIKQARTKQCRLDSRAGQRRGTRARYRQSDSALG